VPGTEAQPPRRDATRRSARPTPELIAELGRLLRAGNYLSAAAHAAGVDAHVLDGWLSKGARDSRGIYRELYEAVAQAQGAGEARHVANIAKAAVDGDWKASAWLLERQYPERWARASQRDMPNAEAPLPSTTDPFAGIDELAEHKRGKRHA
jgi:hypothetical protein